MLKLPLHYFMFLPKQVIVIP